MSSVNTPGSLSIRHHSPPELMAAALHVTIRVAHVIYWKESSTSRVESWCALIRNARFKPGKGRPRCRDNDETADMPSGRSLSTASPAPAGKVLIVPLATADGGAVAARGRAESQAAGIDPYQHHEAVQRAESGITGGVRSIQHHWRFAPPSLCLCCVMPRDLTWC